MADNDKGIITSSVYDGQIYSRLNPVVEKAASLLYRNVDFDDESLSRLNEVNNRGRIVYASFHSSNISLLILYNKLKQHGFQLPVFALEYNPFLFQNVRYIARRVQKFFSRFFLRKKYDYVLDTDYVEELLRDDNSILLSLLSKKFFLKRYMEVKYDSLRYLVEVQKKTDTPIYLMPQMIFWNRNPERTGGTVSSMISSKATGDKGLISGWLSNLRSATSPFIRISVPVNLKDEIAASKTDDSRQIAVQLRNKLLEIYYHEKRTVLGPILKSQQEMMERVLYHPNILQTIKDVAAEDNTSEQKLRKKAFKYYREISANFSILYIRIFEVVLNWMFRKIFDGITYDPKAIEEIREAAQKGPLVLTPCHKSHLDYLILSYIFYKNKMAPPHIAAGVNLSFFPLGTLFRHSGAFFMRRTFRGLKLYPVVFKQYIKTLVSEGYTIEFFIEGGRTRTGKLTFPRLGFLRYLTDAVEEGYNKDLVFVPISINYDRILEESSYAKELKGKSKKKESVSGMMQSRKLLKRKYGRVYVNFNKPFTLKEVTIEENQESLAEAVAVNIIQKINDVVVVTPFSLASTVILLSSVKGFTMETVKKNMGLLFDYCKFAQVPTSEALREKEHMDEIIQYVVDSFKEDHIIAELNEEESEASAVEDLYLLPEDERPRIVFYKNSIIHYFLPISFASLSLLRLADEKLDLTMEAYREIFLSLRNLFTKEFIYSDRMMLDINTVADEALEYLTNENVITREGDNITLNESAENVFRLYSRLIQEYFESYLVVFDTMTKTRQGKQQKKEFILDLRKNGTRMYHTGEIRLAESLSMPNYQNALNMLRSRKIIAEEYVNKRNIVLDIENPGAVEPLREEMIRYIGFITQ